MEMEIDYYAFKPVEYNGKTLFAYASATIDYDVYTEQMDYPLASAGSRTVRDIQVIDIDLSVDTVTDESGNEVYDSDNVPTDLYRLLYAMFKDEADPVEMIRGIL